MLESERERGEKISAARFRQAAFIRKLRWMAVGGGGDGFCMARMGEGGDGFLNMGGG